MTRLRARPIGAVMITLLLLVSCTDSPPDEEPGASLSSPQMPLAVVTHLDRAVDDITRQAADRLRAGDISDWSELGEPAGRLTLVPDDDPAAAVAQVSQDPTAIAVVPADHVRPHVRALTIDGIDPLTSADAPLTTDWPSEPGVVVRTTVVGDIMLGRRVGDHLLGAGDPAAVFRAVAGRLAGADLTIGNLESTLSQLGPPTQGTDSFGADPSVLDGLTLAGFDVISLANNHLGDYGPESVVDTVRQLREAGFTTTGGGATLDEARRPAVVERHGITFGFIATDSIGETPAAGPSSPGTNRVDAPPRTGPLDRAALERVAGDIDALAEKTDVVIVLPHWGTQYTNVPEESQRLMAATFAEAGADVIVGGHPHWVQGWEMIGDTPVVHSLGNFVFDMDFMVENTEGVFVEIVTRGDAVVAVRPVPYVIGDDFAPVVVDGARAETILQRVRETSTDPFDALR